MSNKQTRECKNCGYDVHAEVEIDIAEEDSVTEEVYQERLAICMVCPSLQYGTTCMHSGSIVYYRAMLKDKRCPYPSGGKW